MAVTVLNSEWAIWMAGADWLTDYFCCLCNFACRRLISLPVLLSVTAINIELNIQKTSREYLFPASSSALFWLPWNEREATHEFLRLVSLSIVVVVQLLQKRRTLLETAQQQQYRVNVQHSRHCIVSRWTWGINGGKEDEPRNIQLLVSRGSRTDTRPRCAILNSNIMFQHTERDKPQQQQHRHLTSYDRHQQQIQFAFRLSPGLIS